MELSCSALCELFSAFPAVFPLTIAKDAGSVSGHAPSPSEWCCTAGCCPAVDPNRYPSPCLRKLQNPQVSSAGLWSLCTLTKQVKGRILLAFKEGQKNPSILPMAHLVGSPIVPFPFSTSAWYFAEIMQPQTRNKYSADISRWLSWLIWIFWHFVLGSSCGSVKGLCCASQDVYCLPWSPLDVNNSSPPSVITKNIFWHCLVFTEWEIGLDF